jgi:hypothetical protein
MMSRSTVLSPVGVNQVGAAHGPAPQALGLHPDLRHLEVGHPPDCPGAQTSIDTAIWGEMKTTVELPDDLFVAAKKRAAELRCSLRALIERGLRHELSETKTRGGVKRRIRWVTVRGGLPRGLDVRDRTAMHEWLRAHR